MARDTLPRIRAGALELFSHYQYDTVSVAQICREAGVSNGAFYRYYSDKQAIFKDLLEEFLESFGRDLEGIVGDNRSERLRNFIDVVSGAARRYAGQVTMFREGQYRQPVYERRLRELYIACVERLLGRSVDEAQYLFLLSGLRFISTRSLYHDLPVNDEILVDILQRGAFALERTVSLPDAPPAPAGTPQEEEELYVSTDALLEAGMRLFGERGFLDVQVSDIAREAGLSVGTFYNRFNSKEAFLADIVLRIGRRTRHYLTVHAPPEGNQLDREVLGMWNFLSYFGHHPEYYDIVREAEFVVPLAVKDYYDAFERGYMHRLTAYPETKRRIVANFLMGLSHYLGIEVLFSGRVSDPRQLVEDLGALLARGIEEE
jgi:AcrR family transcriptional regulator